MINLSVKNNNFENIPLIYHFYDDINRIPLEIIFDISSRYREGIIIDNYDEKTGSFITYKFEKETKILCNITIVSIDETGIIYSNFIKNIKTIEGYYQFCINGDDFNTRMGFKTSFTFDNKSNSVLISFDETDFTKLDFYKVDKNLFIGIDSNKNFMGILFKNLKDDEIKKFLNL